MVEILCTHMWNVKTVQWMREGGIKVNDGGNEFNYDVLYCIVRTLVNFTMKPQYHNNRKGPNMIFCHMLSIRNYQCTKLILDQRET
jgi:hypothetical protein